MKRSKKLPPNKRKQWYGYYIKSAPIGMSFEEFLKPSNIIRFSAALIIEGVRRFGGSFNDLGEASQLASKSLEKLK